MGFCDRRISLRIKRKVYKKVVRPAMMYGAETWADSSSSVVSFTQCSPTCGRMPLPALSRWPCHQPCRPRLVDGRRGGGPSSVAPRSRNRPTGRRRDSPISSSPFSHGPPLCAVGLRLANRASPLQIQPAKTRPPPVPFWRRLARLSRAAVCCCSQTS